MLFVFVIYLEIQSSYERLECGKIVTDVSFALEGVKDRIAPWVVSLGLHKSFRPRSTKTN